MGSEMCIRDRFPVEHDLDQQASDDAADGDARPAGYQPPDTDPNVRFIMREKDEKDKPPRWDGTHPETNVVGYVKKLKQWLKITTLEKKKQR